MAETRRARCSHVGHRPASPIKAAQCSSPPHLVHQRRGAAGLLRQRAHVAHVLESKVHSKARLQPRWQQGGAAQQSG